MTSRAEVLALLGELLEEDERAGRVAVDDRSQSRKSTSSSTAPSSWSTSCTVIVPPVAEASWSSVDSASRNAPRPPRAISASAASGTSIPSPSAIRRSLRIRSGSRGRWKTNVWQRERTVGSTFWSSVVQKMKSRWGGGSSISFSSAFQAASVSWCASSRM